MVSVPAAVLAELPILTTELASTAITSPALSPINPPAWTVLPSSTSRVPPYSSA